MRSVWVRALVSAVALTVGVGAAPVVRAATGGWQGASLLAAGGGSEPAVALAADGTAVAAWNGTAERYVAVRAPGSQSFGAPVDLGDAHEGGGPAVATDANGDSVMAWLAEAPIGATLHEIVFDVVVDYRRAGGQFSQSTVATVPGSTYATIAPVVQFLPDGTAVVAWGGSESGGQRVIADSVRAPGVDSQFGPANSYVLPPNTEPGAAYRALQIAPGGGDSASLLWEDVETDWLSQDEYVQDDDLMVGRVDAQGNITAAPVPGASTEEHVVDDSQASYSGTRLMSYALAGDDAGDLAVLWGVMSAASSTATGAVYGTYASSGQPFQRTPDVIDDDALVGGPIAGSMLSSGTTVFASEWQSPGTQYVERTRPAASFPAKLTSLPGVPDASNPQLAAGAGQTIVAYSAGDGQGVYGAVAPDGAPFGSPTQLADTGAIAALAGDGDGNAIALFEESSSSSDEAGLMTDTFAAPTPSDGAEPGSAPVVTTASSPPASTETTATSSSDPSAPSAAANGGASPPGSTKPRRLALRLAAAIAWFPHHRTRARIPARCLTASGRTCVFSGRLFAARWQPRKRAWVKTRIRLGACAGTLHRSRLGQLVIRLAPAGRTALRHSRVVYAWLSGTLRNSRQRMSIAAPIRLER